MGEYGDGVDQSDSTAMRWYTKAAAQGFEEAQTAVNEILARCHCASSVAAESESSGSREQQAKKKADKAGGSKNRNG